MRRTVLNGTANRLRNKIVNAAIAGDDISELVREASKFDADNPAYAVLPDIEAAVARRLRNEAVARATDQPLGVRAADYEAQRVTAY
jgi:hypothetical protein